MYYYVGLRKREWTKPQKFHNYDDALNYIKKIIKDLKPFEEIFIMASLQEIHPI